MRILAAKLILTPLLIALATLAARRWGPAVGGWIAGLPLTSGPVSVFLAIERGRSFAAAAAQATLLGLIAVVSFCVGYGRIGRRLNWPGSCALGFLFYFFAVFILSFLSLGVFASISVVYLAITAAIFLMDTRPVNATIRTAHSSWDLTLRMVTATGLVLLITAGAERIGPIWSGLLSPFPIFATVMAVFSHRTGGPHAAIHLLRGIVIGSYAFGAFFLVVALMIGHWNILETYSLAALVALVANGISLTRIPPVRN
jgi:hypothetical protein